MATANVSENSSQKPRDLMARIVLLVAASCAVFAVVGAIGSVQSVAPVAVVAEVWRMYGLLVFAGLFTLLAVRLRRLAGVWELVIFHKAATAITAYLLARAVA